RQLQMDTDHFSFRFFGHGVVVAALGNLVPGQPGDYTNDQRIRLIAEKYWNQDQRVPLAQVVEEATRATAGGGDRPYGWCIDDKGYIDLLTFGFRVFGFHRTSVYNVWFLALGLPMLLAAVAWAGRPDRLVVLPLVLLALCVVAPLTQLDDQLLSL